LVYVSKEIPGPELNLLNAVIGVASLINCEEEDKKEFFLEKLEDYFVFHETVFGPIEEDYSQDYLWQLIVLEGVEPEKFFENHLEERRQYVCSLVKKIMNNSASMEETVFCYGSISRMIPDYEQFLESVNNVANALRMASEQDDPVMMFKVEEALDLCKREPWYPPIFYDSNPEDSKLFEETLLPNTLILFDETLTSAENFLIKVMEET